MTALTEFERLESLGLWRETPTAQRVEVVISFGDNSIILRDMNDRPITHWSLAAIERVNPKNRPAIYSVDEDHSETLEIEDKTMVKAIERIRSRLVRSRSKPGRLRFILATLALCGFAATAVLWLPNATARYAARVIPDAKLTEIGDRAMEQMERITGKACTSPLGDEALRKLEYRLIGTPSNKIIIANLGTRKSALLPGGTILISESMLSNQQGPELMAGYVLAQRAAQDETPPMLKLFDFAGTKETLRFLANGNIKEGILDAFTEHQLTQSQDIPDLSDLKDLFELVEVPRTLFANSDLRFSNLANNDPFKNEYKPLLNDEDWLALQEICD